LTTAQNKITSKACAERNPARAFILYKYLTVEAIDIAGKKAHNR
jgi:hypothetical protein